MFGNNHVYPELGPSPDEIVCIEAVAAHVDAGRAHQLLLSQDVYLKSMFTRFGGYGYAHLMTNLTRMFHAAGIHESSLKTMLIDNPLSVLCFTTEASAKSGSLARPKWARSSIYQKDLPRWKR
jgi:phosphotriesterase-related protein